MEEEKEKGSVSKSKQYILKTEEWVLTTCWSWAIPRSVSLIAPEILQDENHPSGGHRELPEARSHLSAQGNIAEETWGVLVTEICAPCKGTSKSSLSLLACEDGEKPSVHEPGSRSSVDTESLGSLIFGLPGSRAVRNSKVIVWTTQSRDFCYTSQSSQRHLCLWPWEPLGSSALMQYLPLPSILLSYILR